MGRFIPLQACFLGTCVSDSKPPCWSAGKPCFCSSSAPAQSPPLVNSAFALATNVLLGGRGTKKSSQQHMRRMHQRLPFANCVYIGLVTFPHGRLDCNLRAASGATNPGGKLAVSAAASLAHARLRSGNGLAGKLAGLCW